MKPRTELRLYGRQQEAIQATEPEILLVGDDRPAGASHLLRAAAIVLAFRHRGARIALVSRSADALRRTHLEGLTGLPALLADMQRHGAVTVSDVDAKFENGSRLWWSGAFLETEVADLLRQPLDALLVDDLHAMPQDLYQRLADRVLAAGAAPRRVLAATGELSSWMASRWGNGAADRRLVALRAEDLPEEIATAALVEAPPADTVEWLQAMFPRTFATGFSPYHMEFWRWVGSIVPGLRPRPFVGIWPRGRGKTTSAEAASVLLGAEGRRRYAVYVRASQDQSDKNVENIASLLGSDEIARRYPELAARAVSKYGASKGWRRNRLRTASGFTVDGVGLDKAVRGLKVEDQRPDLIILDDLDDPKDTDRATRRKIETVTKSILPLAAPGVAVLAIQNMIIPDGIFGRLADRRADFLADRIVSGPWKDVEELEYERVEAPDGRVHWVITHGTPTWPELGLSQSQADLNSFGPRAYEEEMQHQLGDREGALLKSGDIQHLGRPIDLDAVVKTAVAIDPSGGGATGTCGIVGGSRIVHKGRARGVVRADVSQPASRGPSHWADTAIDLFIELDADAILAEVNFGGDMVKNTIQVAVAARNAKAREEDPEAPELVVPIVIVRASRGKRQRAEPVATLYETGEVVHEIELPQLEREWTRWVPGDPDSPNRVDAAVWLMTWLMMGGRRKLKIR